MRATSSRARERLGDVVVGADLQPDDLVDLAVLGGQHDDRHVGALPQLPAHLDAGQPRQHQVEQHEVGAVAVELGRAPSGPVAADGDLEALLAQHVGRAASEKDSSSSTTRMRVTGLPRLARVGRQSGRRVIGAGRAAGSGERAAGASAGSTR